MQRGAKQIGDYIEVKGRAENITIGNDIGKCFYNYSVRDSSESQSVSWNRWIGVGESEYVCCSVVCSGVGVSRSWWFGAVK